MVENQYAVDPFSVPYESEEAAREVCCVNFPSVWRHKLKFLFEPDLTACQCNVSEHSPIIICFIVCFLPLQVSSMDIQINRRTLSCLYISGESAYDFHLCYLWIVLAPSSEIQFLDLQSFADGWSISNCRQRTSRCSAIQQTLLSLLRREVCEFTLWSSSSSYLDLIKYCNST